MKHKLKEALHFYEFLNFNMFTIDDNVSEFTPTHRFLKFPTFLMKTVIMGVGMKEGSCTAPAEVARGVVISSSQQAFKIPTAFL